MTNFTLSELHEARLLTRELAVRLAIKDSEPADKARISAETLASMDKAEAIHEWEAMEMHELMRVPQPPV